MLQRTCAGFGLVGMAGLLGPQMLFAAGSARTPHFAPRAKRVIFLFMNGGPSHIDTFDPKPALQKHEGEKPEGEFYRKQKNGGFMPSPFKFAKHGQSGIEISESLPNLARVIDDCCIIRSMRADVPGPPGGLPITQIKLLLPEDWQAFQKSRPEFQREWDRITGLR